MPDSAVGAILQNMSEDKDDILQFMSYLLHNFFSCLAFPLSCRKDRHNGEAEECTQNKT